MHRPLTNVLEWKVCLRCCKNFERLLIHLSGGMNAGVPGGQFGEFAGPGQNPQQKNIEVYAQTMAHQHRAALNNTASPQGMNPGIQGSPMAQSGLDGQQDMFAGNNPRPGMPGNAPGAPPQGNHALQDYQMQLMLLEQQNKKRLLMARQEQDNMGSGPQHQPGVGAQGFPAAMSPQGNRPGPSPNPADQMKRGTPKIGQGMPGSPLPEGAMQQQRGSPAPNMAFDPNLAPPGMPPQYYPQMPQQSPMMRPPSSHPGANFNGQGMTQQQQMEAMRNGQMQPNGAWRGQGQPGMMPNQQPMGGPMGGNLQQRQQMGPPPAPASEQPRPEPSPSQSNQAPPTPSQGSKANPKKKATKDNAKVMLRASLVLLIIVDINCRSPQTRKGQMQVRLQQLPTAKSRQHQLPRLPWRLLLLTASNLLTRKMVNRSKCKLSSLSNRWKALRLVISVVTM